MILITGGSDGVGQTMAKFFSLYGGKIVINYFKAKKEAEQVVAEIKTNNGDAFVVQADVSDRKQVKRMISEINNRYGAVDMLINNAVRDFYPKAFLELDWKDFQRELDVTLKGAFNCCQEVIPSMIKNKAGKITVVSG